MKKKVLIIVAAVLSAVLTIFSTVAMIKAITDAITYVEGQANSGQSGAITGETDVVVNSNRIPITVKDFRLTEPELRIAPYNDSFVYGIRFKAYVPSDMKAKLDRDSTAAFKTMIAPAFYFEELIAANQGLTDFENVDWISVFEANGKQFLNAVADGGFFIEYHNGQEYYSLRGSVSDIMYANTNLDFVGLVYIEYTNGNVVSREYAKLPEGETYASYARSFAYLVADALNREAVEPGYYSAADLTMLRQTKNNSVDLANGQAEETPDDGSDYTVSFSNSLSVAVGQSVVPTVEISPAVSLPLLWVSTSNAIAKVEGGKIVGVAQGVANIKLYVAGTEYSVVVTVTN